MMELLYRCASVLSPSLGQVTPRAGEEWVWVGEVIECTSLPIIIIIIIIITEAYEYILEVLKLMEYVESEADPLIQIVCTHQHKTKLAILRNARNLRKNYRKEQDK